MRRGKERPGQEEERTTPAMNNLTDNVIFTPASNFVIPQCNDHQSLPAPLHLPPCPKILLLLLLFLLLLLLIIIITTAITVTSFGQSRTLRETLGSIIPYLARLLQIASQAPAPTTLTQTSPQPPAAPLTCSSQTHSQHCAGDILSKGIRQDQRYGAGDVFSPWSSHRQRGLLRQCEHLSIPRRSE